MNAPSDRRRQLLAELLAAGGPENGTGHLCDVCADVTTMTGAGIMLMSGDVPRGSLCSTDSVSNVIEQLQYALGEGPCVDAYRDDRPVVEPDLVHPHQARWLAFSGPAIEAGARAVFGFPLRVGAVRLGALNLYRDESGPLTDAQHSDALVLADLCGQAVLVLQADAPADSLATALETGADFQDVVHQASGMVAAQLEITVGRALIRLRAHAFGNDQPLREVAEAVVARRLRFDDRSDDTGDRAGPTQ